MRPRQVWDGGAVDDGDGENYLQHSENIFICGKRGHLISIYKCHRMAFSKLGLKNTGFSIEMFFKMSYVLC